MSGDYVFDLVTGPYISVETLAVEVRAVLDVHKQPQVSFSCIVLRLHNQNKHHMNSLSFSIL